MPSQRTYLVPISSHMPSPSSYAQPNTIPGPSSYVQPQTILQLFPVVRASRSQLMVHLHFIRDVDIHPHHLHVHSTRPFTTTGCSPCFPPLRVTRLLLPPTEGSLDEGRGSQACTSLPSRTVFCLSQLVYLTCDYLVPKHKQAQAKPLKITVPDYKY